MNTQNQIRGNFDVFGAELGSSLTLTAKERKALGEWARHVSADEAPGKPVTIDYVSRDLDKFDDLVISVHREAIAIWVNVEFSDEDLGDLLDIVGGIALRLGFAGTPVVMEHMALGTPNAEGLRPVIMKRFFGELIDRKAA